ncbi:hypothetical protein Ndes2437A_g04896 [Nannochloris sp. 'desiccata']
MDDVIEARLGMSLDDLIKEQKKIVVKKPKKKKPVPAKGGNNAANSKPGVRRPAPAKGGAPPSRPGNPNQRLPKQLPGAKGPGGKPGPLKAIRGGGVQKKGAAAPTAMRIDPVISGNKGRPRNKNGTNAISGPQGGRTRPNNNNNENPSQRGGKPRNPQQQQQQQIQQGRRQPQQQHQHQQQTTNPINSKNKKNKQPPHQQSQRQVNQQQQQYNHGAPPGFGGAPPSHHNPYQDALYAKSQKPLFARFEDLQRVPMDAMAAATVTQQPEFMAGPMNKHGVRLPV